MRGGGAAWWLPLVLLLGRPAPCVGAVAFVLVAWAAVPERRGVSLVGGVFFVVFVASAVPLLFSAAVLVLLAAALDGALVVRIEADAPAGFRAETFPFLSVGVGGPGGGGFREEKGEEFVGDGEMRGLLELLKGKQAEESFEEGERGAVWWENGGRGLIG